SDHPENAQIVGPLTQIDAGVMNVGLAETGPSAGPAVILLHGWPCEWWYQFYFATERGRAGYDTYRRDFATLIWQPTRTSSRPIRAPDHHGWHRTQSPAGSAAGLRPGRGR